MDNLTPYKTDKRRQLLAMAKENAPFIYQSYILPKRMRLKQQIEDLRLRYSYEKNEEERNKIIEQANMLKKEYEVYMI